MTGKSAKAVFFGFLLLLSPLGSEGAGLSQAAPIGPFLGGALPSRSPTALSGSWELVPAFPNLVFVDPIQMLPVPGSDLLMVAEKWGALVVFPDDPETSSRSVVLDLSAQTQVPGDSGLLGLAFHPEYGQPGSPNREFLYVYYRFSPEPSELDRAYCRLSRFTYPAGAGAIDPASEFVLINQYDRHNWHNGGGMFFGDDGFLYLSIGDEGSADDAFESTQRLDRGLFGGVLRIDVDQDPSRSHPIRRQPVDAETPPAGWPSSFSQGYFIPNDNPWQSPDGSALEEFWAIGLRSPHRMTLDPPSGRIWVGDVGQVMEEEVNLIERGANYQWPFREGNRDGAVARPAQLIGTERGPVHRYGRGEGGCVIGGYVYRGSEHPELVGKYLFGDFNNGVIRSLVHDGLGEPLVEEIAEVGDRQLTGFGIDARGELYLLTIGQTFLNGGVVYQLRREGAARPEPPATLSATGAFSNLASLAPRSGLMPYDLVQALWSDGSDKKRWIAIPNDGSPDSPGEQIVFSENGPWEFPVGTVLVKHFELGGRRLETRFIVKGEDGRFFGFTYKWRPDHSDADLLPSPGLEETIPLPGGGSVVWTFPSRVACFECHTEASGVVLGPKTRHLNRDLLYPVTGRVANQIETWAELGFFQNPPATPSLGGMLAAANLLDESESLERRARSYLDINCSHCHLPNGPTQASFDLRLTTPPNWQNLFNIDPDNSFGLIDQKIVKPGEPDRSILLFRLASLEACCAMPPIAKNAVDADAVRVLGEWIASLDPATAPSERQTGTPPTDPTLPRLTLSRPQGPQVAGRFEVQVVASEPIFGLQTSDFIVTNGRILSLSGSGSNYTLAILPRLGGVGTISMPSDRFVDGNGNANPLQEGLFAFEFDQVVPATLLQNGGFEDGLAFWSVGAGTAASTATRTGARGARLSAKGALSQSLAVSGGTDYLLSGWSRREGTRPIVGETFAAVSFWDDEGGWLGERVRPLPMGKFYDSFRASFTAPSGAALATLSLLAPDDGAIHLDDLALSPGGAGDPPGGPLTENSDFERGLLFWEIENDATASSAAQLGQGAARIGSLSSITFSREIRPETRLVMTGAAFTEGEGLQAEAGLSFWSDAGDFLGDASVALAPSSSYRDFFFFADVPEGAERLTMWVRNRGEGAVTVDDLGLVHPPEDPAPDPLDPNTGFESGDLAPWAPSGPVDLVGAARSGTRAALLGLASSLVASRPAQAGARFRFAGFYRTTGDFGVHEAGLVFRDRNGDAIDSETVALFSSDGYAPFELFANAPDGTVAVSAWLYNGASGTLLVDDLELAKISGPSALAAGLEGSAHVRLSGRRTGAHLSARDPRVFSNPDDNRGRPDLAVRAPRRNFLGVGLADPNGRRQTAVAATSPRTRRVTFAVLWQNDAPRRSDSSILRGTRGNRLHSLSYVETWPVRGNRTALVVAGRYRTPEATPGSTALYEARLLRKNPRRRSTFQASLGAQSVLSPAARDQVRMRLR
jgi:uncharacterized repeat protein (TIGR03806 family)